MRFALLGPLRVHDEDHEIAIRAPKQRVLLAGLLVAPGRTQNTDRLLDVLWADGKPTGSRDALQMQMVRLRRTVGERIARRIVTKPDGYLIEVEEAELDLSRFLGLSELARRAAQAGRWGQAQTLLRDSLDLWTGSPLQDVPSERLRDEYEPYLTELRLSAVQLGVDARLNLGHGEGLVGELRELVRSHPLRERLVAQLMLALYRSGRQADALLAYQDARSRLIADLGVEPGTELRALHQRILRGTEAVPSSAQPCATARPAPAQLPPRISDFTGRDEQLRTLHELLTSGHGPGVAAVIGAGGAGKTTLVVQAGHLHREYFPDGQLYAVMRGAGGQPVPAGDVLDRFLRDLGIDGSGMPADTDERALLYRSLLAERRVLVVLDDVRDAAQVRSLLPAGPGNAVLVTSRDRLAGLDAIARLHLEVLGATESRELFRRIVGDARVQAEPEATGRVLAICAGLPLALRVAGARLAAQPSRTVAGLASKLADESRRLDALEAGDRGVRASFQVSYAELPPACARVFRLLGLWDGVTISVLAAAALVGETEVVTEELAELLVDAHMLEARSPGSYRFHDLMRSFAAERAGQEEREADREFALHRLLTWYLRTADAACGLIEPLRSFSAAGIDAGVTVNGLGFASRDDAVAWCDAERENLMAAVCVRARLSIDTPGWPLPLVLAHYYNLRGLWADWIATHEIGLVGADRAGDRYGQARVLLSLGRAHTDLEHFDVAAASYEEAFSLFRELDADKEALRALANLASLHGDRGMWQKAFAAHTEALAMSRALGDEHSEAVVLGNLGRAAASLGRLDDGVRFLRQALAMRRRHHDLRGQGVVLHNLGETYWRLGCIDEAVDHYQQALRMRREAGYRLGEARTLSDLGRLYLDRRSNQAARACLTQALQIFEDLNAPEASEVRDWLRGSGSNSLD